MGALPDAGLYGDAGSNTLANLASTLGKPPTLEKLGIGNLGSFPGISRQSSYVGIIGRMAERSAGKDTTTGHWEIAGLVTREPFPIFPNGFPKDLVGQFVAEAHISGVLGNRAASGTTIIEELGEEHLSSGKPIIYTSADSVFQVAAHEVAFGLERLYRVCEAARKVTLPYQIGRVIARPFVGKCSGDFRRTEHRKDYSIEPGRNCLDELARNGVAVHSVEKLKTFFATGQSTAGIIRKQQRQSRGNAGSYQKMSWGEGLCFLKPRGHRHAIRSSPGSQGLRKLPGKARCLSA